MKRMSHKRYVLQHRLESDVVVMKSPRTREILLPLFRATQRIALNRPGKAACLQDAILRIALCDSFLENFKP